MTILLTQKSLRWYDLVLRKKGEDITKIIIHNIKLHGKIRRRMPTKR